MMSPFYSKILLSLLYIPSFQSLKGLFSIPNYRRTVLFSSNSVAEVARNGVKFSESGAAMEIENVFLSIGNNDIISDINWSIMPKERWALVGRNGAGKSTLLKALTGNGGENVNIREGSISLAKKARMGYLEQKGVSGSTKTVREEVSSRMDRLRAATAALEATEKAVTDGDTSDAALIALEESQIEFEAAGGYTVDQKIGNVLKGLGFLDEDYDRYCAEFSGGWQMRIALARLLLSEPDLLLLDEPTNHLDKGARDWLGKYLANYDGTLLVVSHDSELLSTAANSIAEVRGGKLELYKSRSHEQWMVEREERVRNAQALYEANQREIARLQGFVDRFGAKTMGASMAQSRLKTIEKLETTGPEAPQVVDEPAPFLRLPNPPRGSQRLLQLRDAVIAWTPSSEPIIRKCDFVIERGMRIAVRGPNGAGKSTLMSALSGKLPLLSGARIEGDGLELGAFTQDLAQDLDQEALAKDVVTQKVRVVNPSLSDEQARTVLGTLGLTGAKAVRKVGLLSGGEKARVALASFVLIPHNLLLLDEPSNHLDVTTLKVLTAALRKFEGAVLVISHDRLFLEELEPTHIITVRGGVATMEERGLVEGDWNDPLDSRGGGGCAGENEQKFAATKTQIEQPAKPAVVNEETRKKILNAPKRIKKIESMLEKHESDKEATDNLIYQSGKDSKKLKELLAKKADLQAKVDTLYAEYEELLTLVK